MQDLAAWRVALPLLSSLLPFISDQDPLKRRLAELSSEFFEALSQGYHSYHYRDKLKRYLTARDSLCSLAALAALSGDERLSHAVQDEAIPSVTALVRSMEKKERKDGSGG